MKRKLPKIGDLYRAKDDKSFKVEIIYSYGNLLGGSVLYRSKEMTATADKKLHEFLEEFELDK